MPSSKLAFLRYLLIDEMLRNKQRKFPTKEEILEACNDRFGVTSASTIEKDLNAMRFEFDAPIEYNKKEKGYEYTEKSYKFLGLSHLSQQDVLALTFVESVLKDFRELPIFAEFSDAVDKVIDGVQMTKATKNNTAKAVHHQCVKIDKIPYINGNTQLSQLINPIINKKVIDIFYKKFNAETTKKYTIHPYLLKEYKNMWYLIGYVDDYKEVRTFGIDRMTYIEETDKTYIPAQAINFDADNFYKHCLGVTALDSPPEKIVLQFAAPAMHYIKTQPLHSSQVVEEETDNYCTVALELVINYELLREILSYGSQVKVVSPITLQQQVEKELAASLQLYNGK